MLLTISARHSPATDLGYLLAKHPDRVQIFDLSFGKVHVFYPHAADDRCTAALLLDVDPVGMVRGKSAHSAFVLAQYVNDRPYAASSLMSVAISQVFGLALNGRCNTRPELPTTSLPLAASLSALPVRGGEAMLHRLFEPIGYTVTAARHPLDERFPEWGESPYYAVTLSATTTLSALLTHLYVLIPVFDNQKHYFVGDDEIDKLLAKGGNWLAAHPEKEYITRRYLKNRPNLVRQALARLVDETATSDEDEVDATIAKNRDEEILEKPLSLNEQRLGAVLAALRSCSAQSVLDLGCGEGMVVKPLDFIARANNELVQPAVKCRGREYLRVIYGPDYTADEHLTRLRNRGLGRKRSLALSEFALGLEALERFVRREPLRRVHECVFGVLALESEPVDPRL